MACAGCMTARSRTQHGEPARRRERTKLAMRQARFGEAGANAGGKSALEFRQRERRQLFGAQLDQKIADGRGHDDAPRAGLFSIGKPSASRLS